MRSRKNRDNVLIRNLDNVLTRNIAGKKQMVELSGVAHSPANFDDDDNPCGPDCYKLPEGAVNTVRISFISMFLLSNHNKC